jgi:hypothetical protein
MSEPSFERRNSRVSREGSSGLVIEAFAWTIA